MFNIERPLSEAAAAAYIGISISGLRKWRKTGKAPSHFRVGRIIRYSKRTLDDFIAAHSSNTGDEDGKQ
jgi:hypothetical protein